MYAPPRGPNRRQSVQSYASVGLETEVLGASPTKLITLLFNGARAAVMKARMYMENGNIPEKGKAISKAMDIVESGLKASINREAGGEVAQSLLTSYDLILHHLFTANLHNDIEKLNLAEHMLTEIADAWRQVSEAVDAETVLDNTKA